MLENVIFTLGNVIFALRNFKICLDVVKHKPSKQPNFKRHEDSINLPDFQNGKKNPINNWKLYGLFEFQIQLGETTDKSPIV